jgi:hypothetical protein
MRAKRGHTNADKPSTILHHFSPQYALSQHDRPKPLDEQAVASRYPPQMYVAGEQDPHLTPTIVFSVPFYFQLHLLQALKVWVCVPDQIYLDLDDLHAFPSKHPVIAVSQDSSLHLPMYYLNLYHILAT